ncbi:hypothetical protein Pth03_07930 [Planotetraspora thailandica]|uniref:Uncharacterized protein n=1 Tax=Planotetraspora thailandica TaxID=487172 RepID=A0A8J3UUU8_9ACTN|nr:hypothetical protein [Planotetraspora thailandica]GII52404.1 hypothetical protein Pth03_07930 [Planotetraspora thailandica]
MTAGQHPHLVDVFPDLTADIIALLRVQNENDPLADAVEDLLFYGVCTCSATCTNLLTAPPGSSSSWMVELERDGESVIWLSLNPTATAITDIEVLDGRDLGPASRRGDVSA